MPLSIMLISIIGLMDILLMKVLGLLCIGVKMLT